MPIEKRMKALLNEMEMLGSEYYSKAKDEGDAQLARLSFEDGSGYYSGEFLFADAADAKAAGALLKPFGYSTAKTAAAPYFSSLDAFKASKFYQEQLKAQQTRAAADEMAKRAKKLDFKYVRVDKPFLGEPAGSLFQLVNDFGTYAITAYTPKASGNFSTRRAWELYSPKSEKDVAKMVAVLDVLEKGTLVKDPYGR